METNCLCTLESRIYPGKPVRPFDWAVSMAAYGSRFQSRRLPLESEVVIKFHLVSGRRISHIRSPK